MLAHGALDVRVQLSLSTSLGKTADGLRFGAGLPFSATEDEVRLCDGLRPDYGFDLSQLRRHNRAAPETKVRVPESRNHLTLQGILQDTRTDGLARSSPGTYWSC